MGGGTANGHKKKRSREREGNSVELGRGAVVTFQICPNLHLLTSHPCGEWAALVWGWGGIIRNSNQDKTRVGLGWVSIHPPLVSCGEQERLKSMYVGTSPGTTRVNKSFGGE